MKNNNPLLIQVDESLIIRNESISSIKYNEEGKEYIFVVDGNILYLSKEKGEKILNKMSIKP